jgi:hypothetical protein
MTRSTVNAFRSALDCDGLHHPLLRAWASLISLTLTRVVHLHSDPLALRAPPFSLLVVDVPFEFLHGDFAALAGHGCSLRFGDRTGPTIGTVPIRRSDLQQITEASLSATAGR